MKQRNMVIIALLLIGLGALALIEGYIKPEMRRKEEQDLAEQQEPLTHDFSRLLQFKSRYMGDVSNLANLNGALPLGDIPRTFQLYPETLTAEINYHGSSAAVPADLFERALIYNATANFVLIDNLETLTHNFAEGSYSITRRAVESWYGTAPAALQDEARWAEKVQQPLSERAYVRSFFEENFTVQRHR